MRENVIIVGLQKILSLLEAEDADVRIHAVKVVANLAAEGEIAFFYVLIFSVLLHHKFLNNFLIISPSSCHIYSYYYSCCLLFLIPLGFQVHCSLIYILYMLNKVL